VHVHILFLLPKLMVLQQNPPTTNVLAKLEEKVWAVTTYFTFYTPFGSTTLRIGSFCQSNMHIYKWKWSTVQSFKSLWSVIEEERWEKKSNLILLSRKYAHLQMTMKYCTKSSRRKIQHQLFHNLHPYGSTIIQKNNWILPLWLH
jgi:hypothetical protein